MRKRRLGRTGLQVTEIGFGGIPIQKVTQEETTAIIKACHEEGINFIDTARGYTNSEEMIGNALVELYGESRHDKFIVATKSMSRTYDTMKADIETSLRNLKVDHIHLYQCHFIKEQAQYDMIMGADGAMKALKEAQDAGKIGHIGFTAHGVDMAKVILSEGHFDTVQFPYNPIEDQAVPLFEQAFKGDVGVIVMKPLAGGTIEDGPLALKYIMNNGHVTVAIPGMDSVGQVLENAAVGRNPMELDQNEKASVAQLKETYADAFCRRCGYCMPCPQNIDIPFQFLLNGYITRYQLEDWAMQRYDAISVHASDCTACGLCESRCPYGLPIRQMMAETSELFDGILIKRGRK